MHRTAGRSQEGRSPTGIRYARPYGIERGLEAQPQAHWIQERGWHFVVKSSGDLTTCRTRADSATLCRPNGAVKKAHQHNPFTRAASLRLQPSLDQYPQERVQLPLNVLSGWREWPSSQCRL